MATAATWTDSDLLRRLRRRDRTAWEELYRTYEKRLYGFAYRLSGNQHDAADLFQETFVRALPKLDRLPPERANIGAYLFATAKNLFLKQTERTKRALPVDEVPEPAEPGDIEEDPQRAALLRRQQDEVRIANDKLAPRQRLVLALRELEDKSYAEIGELIGLNENAVAQLILRARQSLRDELRLVQVDRSKLSEVCQGYLPLLSAHLDGQLRGAKQTETLAHLESCEDCQKALADMEEAKRRYRALVPPLVAIVALREKVDAALAANGYWDTPAGGHPVPCAGLGRRGMLVATIAGVAILGGLVIGVGGGGGAQPPDSAGSVQAGAPAEASAVSSEQPSTPPSSHSTAPESTTGPDETTEGETGPHPASGEGDPSAVGDASAGGDNQPDTSGRENGTSNEPEPNDSQGGGAEQPVANGGASGGGGGPESDDSQGGGRGSSQGGEGSRGDEGSQTDDSIPAGEGSRGDGTSQPDDESRGDETPPEDDGEAADGSRGDETPPEDDGSRDDASSRESGSLADEGTRGGESPPEDDGSRGDTSSQADSGSQESDGSRGDAASQTDETTRTDEGSEADDTSRADDSAQRTKALE